MKINNRFKKAKITFILVGLVTAIVLTSAGSARADTWTQKADMPTARSWSSTSVVNGKIYAIGGYVPGVSGYPGVVTVEVYDPATDTWTTALVMPTGRFGHRTSVVDGKIYAIGGRTTWGAAACRTVEEYDPNPLVVDFNGDGIVDCADMCMMLDYWGTDEAFFDIDPMPFGDGIVDVQDLIVLAEHLLTYPGAVAYWKLDETEGDIAYDSVGEYNGTFNGEPLWQPEGGMVGGALQFDGIDDYVFTPSFVLATLYYEFSVFAWVQGGAPGQTIISQIRRTKDWLYADPSDGCLITELRHHAIDDQPLLSQAVITDGQWHRVGLVWDGTYRTLYVDDVEVASDDQESVGVLYGGLNIGAGKNLEPGSFWSGLIDDVRIYNRAVTP